MNDSSILTILTRQLDPAFAILVILVGLYSIYINVKCDTQNSHPRSAKLARIGGWCYITGGIILLIVLYI